MYFPPEVDFLHSWANFQGDGLYKSPGGGGGTPLQGLNGDVRPARVCFSGFLS